MEKILIIEDDRLLLETTSAFLQSEGFLTQSASDGIQGLELATSGDFDLVLTDFVLPSLNGVEICRRLRERGVRTPVIMLTGEKREEIDKVLGLELGADDYLIKPVGMRELLARIHAVLRRNSSGREGTGTKSRGGRECPKCRFLNPSETRFCGECGTPLTALRPVPASRTETLKTPITELTTGVTFARRYQIIEELGHGGMGRLYKVLDKEIQEKVALKLLNPEIASDEETIERFRNELKLARRISHKNVCRMFDINREEGTYYITMEYIEGEDLKSLIRRIGPLTVRKAVFIARQVCDGLAEAHRFRVIHRDLKPQNIMVDKEGNARVMDFGIARSLRVKGVTGAGMMIGTPEYMSPEQVDGRETDERSDFYSLGVSLFEMLTGRLPFEGDTMLGIALKQKNDPPPDPRKINPQIPQGLGRIILKCLDKEKARRYERAEDLLADLDAVAGRLEKTDRVRRTDEPTEVL
jgi:CheY-like chemotaxis protein